MDTENTVSDSLEEVSETSTAEKAVETPDKNVDVAETGDKPQDPAKQSLLSDLHKERTNRKSLQAEVSKLNKQLEEDQAKLLELDDIKHKYDRLEELLLAVGGEVSRMLDSRTLTKRLFGSEDPLSDIIQDWHKTNPTATSSALSSKSSEKAVGSKMNDLLRAAAS